MNNQKVFMVMPFSHDIANQAFEHVIKPVCIKRNLEVRRSDTLFSTNAFYDDIVQEITDANIVIVDITDNNPNVMYELGISHTLKRHRTVIISNSPLADMPSDFKHMRAIKYENGISGAAEFKSNISQTLDHLLTDSMEKYQSEFNYLFEVLSSTKQWHLMIAIVGFKKIGRILSVTERLYFEGKYPNTESTHSQFLTEKYLEFYSKNKFLSLENGLISLTNKGILFSQFVEERGVDCFFMNDVSIKEDYKLLFNRIIEKGENDNIEKDM